MSTDQALESERRGGILTLRLNRPQQLNALSHALLLELDRTLETLQAEESLRCLILAGAGRAFCAGHDLTEMRALRTAQAARALFDLCGRVMQRIRALPVPVIARVQGIATAAGCQLVGTCDLAIAADTAKFAVSGINVGLFCSTPAVALSRNVSTKRAFELLVTGRFIDAPTAREFGLINEVVPEAELDDAVLRKAAEIAGKSSAALRHGKALFYRQQGLDLAQAYAQASEVMARNLLEDDAASGIEDFLARR
ncbi:MAG TPA: enoyl-CoA hydratase [Steroidobacteraceae bacterium]|nr:enoyl-CoA hydratase [Steroidobacteraceae bacterium]